MHLLWGLYYIGDGTSNNRFGYSFSRHEAARILTWVFFLQYRKREEKVRASGEVSPDLGIAESTGTNTAVGLTVDSARQMLRGLFDYLGLRAKRSKKLKKTKKSEDGDGNSAKVANGLGENLRTERAGRVKIDLYSKNLYILNYQDGLPAEKASMIWRRDQSM